MFIKRSGEKMERMDVKELKLSSDIKLVDDVLNGKLGVSQGTYNGHSMIYRTTNETISNQIYYDKLKGKKKVLAITGSADHIINAVLQGAEYVKGIDICRFAKYYARLKFAAIKSLTREEFIEFIIGSITDGPNMILPFNKKYYDKLRDNLDSKSQKFWDHIFSNYSRKHLYYSNLFGTFNISPERAVRNNPYLQGNNYMLAGRRLERTSIELIDGDIFNIDMRGFDKFDLAIMTNMLSCIPYSGNGAFDRAEMYKAFLRTLPLKENGSALTYNFIFDGFYRTYFEDKDFNVYNIDERMVNIKMENELIEYVKPRRLGLSMFRRK